MSNGIYNSKNELVDTVVIGNDCTATSKDLPYGKYTVKELEPIDVNIDKPIVLLVDSSSASASEIFSGALKDYNRATLVGTKTYGKGMVQKIISMPNETGINLTVAKYLTPKGKELKEAGERAFKENFKKGRRHRKAETPVES